MRFFDGTGSGALATFRIFPLQAGPTQPVFSQAELTRALFETRDGQRIGTGSESLAFTPILLELNITGATVEPPSEATATPTATETPVVAAPDVPTVQPTLVNATAAPRTPEAPAVLEADTPGAVSSPSLLFVLAIGLMPVGAGGLLVLLVIQRHKSR